MKTLRGKFSFLCLKQFFRMSSDRIHREILKITVINQGEQSRSAKIEGEYRYKRLKRFNFSHLNLPVAINFMKRSKKERTRISLASANKKKKVFVT